MAFLDVGRCLRGAAERQGIEVGGLGRVGPEIELGREAVVGRVVGAWHSRSGGVERGLGQGLLMDQPSRAMGAAWRKLVGELRVVEVVGEMLGLELTWSFLFYQREGWRGRTPFRTGRRGYFESEGRDRTGREASLVSFGAARP